MPRNSSPRGAGMDELGLGCSPNHPRPRRMPAVDRYARQEEEEEGRTERSRDRVADIASDPQMEARLSHALSCKGLNFLSLYFVRAQLTHSLSRSGEMSHARTYISRNEYDKPRRIPKTGISDAGKQVGIEIYPSRSAIPFYLVMDVNKKTKGNTKG